MLVIQICTNVSSTRSSGTDGRSPAKDVSMTFSLSRFSAVDSSSAGSVTGAAPRERSASITVAMWPTHFCMGFDTVVPQHPGDSVDERPLMDFTPGYVLRALDYLPKAGSVIPWRLKQNYLLDLQLIRRGRVDDEALHFAKKLAALAV